MASHLCLEMMDEIASGCPRYEHEILAWEYDQRMSELAPGELEWYLAYADRANHPILELSCGSGRLLIPIARAGYEIDGVDISNAMLSRLDSKIRLLDRRAQSRISFYCVDMAEFRPKRKYAMAFIGLNSLQYLETRERIRSCLHRVFGFLEHGGFFLIMVQQVDLPRYLANERVAIDWIDEPIVDEDRGLSVGSRFVSYLEPGGARIVRERTYRWRRGTTSDVVQCVTYSPILATFDYIEMLEEAGFTARAYGGYDERPGDGTSGTICFVCQKWPRGKSSCGSN